MNTLPFFRLVRRALRPLTALITLTALPPLLPCLRVARSSQVTISMKMYRCQLRYTRLQLYNAHKPALRHGSLRRAGSVRAWCGHSGVGLEEGLGTGVVRGVRTGKLCAAACGGSEKVEQCGGDVCCAECAGFCAGSGRRLREHTRVSERAGDKVKGTYQICAELVGRDFVWEKAE